MDMDEIKDVGGTIGVVVLAGGSLFGVWADGAIDIVWGVSTIGVIVLDVAALDVWWGVVIGFAATLADANGVVL